MASSGIIWQPQARGLISTLFERTVSWMLGYPAERSNFTTQGVRIPVSSGLARIELAADLFQPLLPDGSKPKGTILMQSPYGRGLLIGLQSHVYASRGYQVLLVSSRGTFESGGEFDAFRTDVDDGKAIVEWMRKQSWYTGTFATVGASYLGYVQWALLNDPPKDMVAAVPMVAPQDFARVIWCTGALNLDIVLWADMVAHQEEPKLSWKALKSKPKLASVLKSAPLAQNLRAFFGDGSPWVHSIIEKSDISDPYYAPMRLDQALERIDMPVLIVTGWYDLFLEQSMEQYYRLKARGCNVALTVGPWAHVKVLMNKRSNLQPFEWIEEHLGGNADAKRAAAVQYFVTGSKQWKNAATFPPSTTPATLYLQEGGKLQIEHVPTQSGSSKFTFDPRDPTPAIGGNGLLSGGSFDDSALSKRNDVLVFESAPLEADFEFCGPPIMSVTHSSNSPFADIFVRVSEVNEKGKSINITEAFKRLDPDRSDDDEIELALYHCAHRFLRGKRIRVLIAGGNFPMYALNQGVENCANNATEMRAVEHTIHFGGVRSSRIVFPTVA